MRRLLLISTTALALSLAVFAAWSFSDSGSHRAEARPLINCTLVRDTTVSPPIETVTCDGHIVIITPFGTKVIDFQLVVTAVDNDPPGPSKGDVISSCTVAVNGGAPKVTHIGPCP